MTEVQQRSLYWSHWRNNKQLLTHSRHSHLQRDWWGRATELETVCKLVFFIIPCRDYNFCLSALGSGWSVTSGRHRQSLTWRCSCRVKAQQAACCDSRAKHTLATPMTRRRGVSFECVSFAAGKRLKMA